MNYKEHMMRVGGLAATTLFIGLTAVTAVYAEPPPWAGPPPWAHKPPPVVHSAPGPIVGVGLPVLVAAGGLAWLRRRKREAASQFSKEA